jgi:hypothetical protein
MHYNRGSAYIFYNIMKEYRTQLNKIMVILSVLGVLAVFLALTNPQRIALPLLLVPFLLIGTLVFLIVRLFLPLQTDKKSLTSRIIPVMLSIFSVIILLLSSLHQLTWRDTLLVTGFGLLFILYISRADFLSK